ncbi:hypothetical protein ACFORL_02570 [Legionella dresdenensis]|uniref:Thioredoxin domain-containing protein n=1 Tax=Legionella dresdenensis TaxID=450200 RepID=A0ABV8CCF6_9GAMM
MRFSGFILLIMLGLWSTFNHAADPAITWYNYEPGRQVTLNVNLFLSSTCPHCQKTNQFFTELEQTEKWLAVKRYYINDQKADLITFNHYLEQIKATDFAVPSIFFCNTRWVGFADDGSTGKQLLKALQFCRQQIAKQGELKQGTVDAIARMSASNWYDVSLSAEKKPVSALRFIPTMSAVDAVSSGTVFTLIALLSLLVLIPGTAKWIGAVLFLAGTALSHCLQQVNNQLLYQLLPYIRLPAALIGLAVCSAVIICAVRKYNWRTMPSDGWILLFTLLSLPLQFYPQLTLPNFSLMFQQWLTVQNLTLAVQIRYLIIYHLIYLTVISAIAGLFYVIYYYFKAEGSRYLFIFANVFLALTGAMLVIYPYVLANYLSFIVIVTLSALIAWVQSYYQKKANKDMP